MFDLSIGELLLIAGAGLIFIGPNELPNVLRSVFKVWRQVQEIVGELRQNLELLADESGLKETECEIRTIIDQDGRVQEIYDISDFLDENNEPLKISQQPLPNEKLAQDVAEKINEPTHDGKHD